MYRPVYIDGDPNVPGSLAKAARHNVLARMAAGESLDEILLDVLLACPATERAGRSDDSLYEHVEELVGWLVSDLGAGIAVGEILRVATEGVPRPDPEGHDGKG